MHRRTVLIGSASAAATALAGCATLGSDSGGGSSEPTDPVESIVEASAANDTAAAEGALHPMGPLSDGLPRSVEDRTFGLENATVVSQANGTAVVEANVSVTEDGQRWHEPRTFEVREITDEEASENREGVWTVWSMETGPEVALREYVEAVDAGDTSTATERLHPDSPDTEWVDATVVEAATLSIEDVSLATSWSDETTIDATVVETVDGEESSEERSIELRRTEEGWRVWSLRYGPVIPVYRYVRAINENDAEILQAAVHPESPQGASGSDDGLSQLEVESVESVTVTEIGDGEASVDVTLTFSALDRTATTSARFINRPSDGQWLLYDSETLDDGNDP